MNRLSPDGSNAKALSDLDQTFVSSCHSPVGRRAAHSHGDGLRRAALGCVGQRGLIGTDVALLGRKLTVQLWRE